MNDNNIYNSDMHLFPIENGAYVNKLNFSIQKQKKSLSKSLILKFLFHCKLYESMTYVPM